MSAITPLILKLPASARVTFLLKTANFGTAACLGKDPRLADLGKVLKDEYSAMKEEYSACTPFCHSPPSQLPVPAAILRGLKREPTNSCIRAHFSWDGVWGQQNGPDSVSQLHPKIP